MPLENSITRSILDYLSSLPNCTAEKVKGSASSSGKADINACYRGRALRIEVKTPDHKNKASKKQEWNLEKWYRAGAIVMVVYSLESTLVFLNKIDKNRIGMFVVSDRGCTSWVKIPLI